MSGQLQDPRLRDATEKVVDELGLIWPDECESMHVDIARAVLEVADHHQRRSLHSDSCLAWKGPHCICSLGAPRDY